MRLQAIINLRLHDFANDVDEICDQSVKEDKMEKQLQVWCPRGHGALGLSARRGGAGRLASGSGDNRSPERKHLRRIAARLLLHGVS